MKRMKKVCAVMLGVAMLVGVTASAAVSNSGSQDGIQAVIQTDKNSYAANEDIQVNITVTNTNGHTVKNVSIEGLLPDDLTLKDGSLQSDTVDLGAGETLTLDCVAVLEKEIVTDPETTEPETTEPDTTEPATEPPTEPESSTELPTESEPVVTEPIEPTTETTEPEETETDTTLPETTTEETTTSESTTEEPSTVEPTTTEPTTVEPSTIPDTTVPVTEEPSTEEDTTDGGIILPVEPTTDRNSPTTTEPDSSAENTPDNPNTSDSSTVIKVLACLAVAGAVVVAIVVIQKKNSKKATRVISLVLCGAIAISGIATTGFLSVSAEEDNSRSFTVQTVITVDGTQETIVGNITYDIDNGLSLTIDQNDFQTQTSKTSLSGTISSGTDNCVVEYKLYSEIDNYEESFTGTAEITGTNWTLDEVFLKSGNNKIVVMATSNGQSVSKTINIYYDMGEFYEPNQDDIVYDEENDLHYVDNIVLILFNQETSDERKTEIIHSIGGQVVGRTDFFYQIKVENASYDTLQNICDKLLEHDEVFYASPDTAGQYDETSMLIPDDPWSGNIITPEFWDELGASGANWGMEAIQAPSAWSYKDRFNHIDVAVVDTGFDLDHEDLEGVFKPSSVLAESRNDYRDVDDNGNTYNNSHGTHVAGIIGAIDNNETGVTGLLWDSKIYYTDWEPYSKKQKWDVDSSIIYSLICSVEAGAKVINYSLGANWKIDNTTFLNKYDGDLSKLNCSQDWKNRQARLSSGAMAMLLEKNYDFIVVQSAGNGVPVEIEPREWKTVAIDATNNGFWSSVTENNVIAPDHLKQQVLDRIIVVGAVKRNLDGNYQQRVTSNGGKRVDICAPGEDIYSTCVNNKYCKKSGTSMAAPHVTGVCGMVWSVNPNFTGAEVKAIVCDEQNTTQKVYDNPDYYHPLFDEYRMVNAKLAVEEALRRTDSQGNVTGVVKNKVTNAPISNVKLEVIDNSDGDFETVATTNKNGNYSLNLPAGSYSVSFSHPNYEYHGISLTVEKGATTVTMDPVYLTPKNSGNPGENPTPDDNFAGGDGSIENPYQIATARQLDAVRNHLDSNFVLINDIDLSEYSNWVPIGGYKNVEEGDGLRGSFDGQGHTISNLKMDYTLMLSDNTERDRYSFGLFSDSSLSSEIKNVNLKNVSIHVHFNDDGDLGSVRIGGISANASTITDCIVSGNINVTGAMVGGNYCGGIAGYANYVYKSISRANICVQQTNPKQTAINARTTVAGIVGYVNPSGCVSDCINYGDIKGNISINTGLYTYEWPTIGCSGIVGYSIGKQITNCRNYGSIESSCDEGASASGIVAEDNGATILRCANYGDLSAYSYAGGDTYASGIISLARYTTVVEQSVNFGDLIASTTNSYNFRVAHCGGIISRGTFDVTINSCYNLGKNLNAFSDNTPPDMGRIVGIYALISNSYSLESTLLNSELAVTDIGPDQKNGGSMTRAEIEKAVTDLGFELPGQAQYIVWKGIPQTVLSTKK